MQPCKTFVFFSLFLTVADHLLSVFLITPLVITFWRAVWILIDIYLYQKNVFFRSVICTALGYSGQLLLYALEKPLTNYLQIKNKYFLFVVVSRIYTILAAYISVISWSGPWALYFWKMNMTSILNSALFTVLSVIVLGFLRCLKSASSVPLFIATDCHMGYFSVKTRFKMKVCGCM